MRWFTRWFTRQSHAEEAAALWLYVACGRCGEAIRIRADRRYDLASEMLDPGENGPSYTMHKDIVGTRCFQRIAVDVGFNQRLQIVERSIHGGRWLTADEYQVATTAPQLPPTGAAGEGAAAGTEHA